MSLEQKTVIDDTIIELLKKSWDLTMTTYDLWKIAVHEKKPVHITLFNKVKKLADEVKLICEELP